MRRPNYWLVFAFFVALFEAPVRTVVWTWTYHISMPLMLAFPMAGLLTLSMKLTLDNVKTESSL